MSTQARDIVAELPQEQQKILTDYFEKANLIADHECAFLYVQGAKDCIGLLKISARCKESIMDRASTAAGASLHT